MRVATHRTKCDSRLGLNSLLKLQWPKFGWEIIYYDLRTIKWSWRSVKEVCPSIVIQGLYHSFCLLDYTAGYPMSYKLGPRWDDVITWSDFKSETSFGFLGSKWPCLTSRRVGGVFQRGLGTKLALWSQIIFLVSRKHTTSVILVR